MRGVIDRFEGQFAVIIFDDGKIENIKKKILPSQAREGDVVVFNDSVYIDYVETEKRKKAQSKHLDLWED